MTTAGRPEWQISSFSSNGEACVEVAPDPDRVLVRDSKCHDGGVIEFTRSAWTAFTTEVRHG